MNKIAVVTSLVAVAALSGCVAYPAYQPAYQPIPVARLTPAQSAALAAQPIDPAERDRLARLNAEVSREDQASIEAARQAAIAQSYYYSAPAPYYGYYGYGYPYYYPWVPGLSLSLGFSRGWGGGYYRGHHGGWHGGGRGHR